jgi:hypothetical protein
MNNVDSSEEDSKPPARNPSEPEPHKLPDTKRKRSGDSEAGGRLKNSPPGVQNVASLPAAKSVECHTAITAQPATASGTKKSFAKRPPSEGPASKRSRQRLRATEEKVPENETPEEKRLRRNRINDRRKRARRAMKVDFLNEQRQSMRTQNDLIRTENQALREHIAAIRRSRGLVYDDQAALPPGNAEVGQMSGGAGEADAGQSKPSEVLSNSIRSRLDGSILAAMNRHLPTPRVLPAAKEITLEIPKARRKGFQRGAHQRRRGMSSGGNAETVLASPQQERASEVAPSLSSLRREPQYPGIVSSESLEHPNLAIARSASVQQCKQGGRSLDKHPVLPNHGQPSGSVNQDRQNQGPVTLLSSLQQQSISESDARSTSLQQSQSSGASTVRDSSRQTDRTDNLMDVSYRHERQTTELPLPPLPTQGGNSFNNSELLFAALQPQLGRGRGASRSTRGDASITRDQRLADFVLPTDTASNSTADILWSSLQNRDGQLTTYQDQLTSLILRQAVGETKEELPTPEQPSLQGVSSMDSVLTMLRQTQESEAHFLAALQQLVQPHSAGSSRNDPLESLRRQLQGRSDELTGRGSTSQQPLQSGSQSDALASLLIQRHASLERSGTSFLQQPVGTDRITSEFIAALQQLQGGDRTTPDMAQIFQSQSQAWDGLLPSRQSNEPTEGRLARLQLQHGGNPAFEGILARLQQPLGGGSAIGRQSSAISNTQQQSSSENQFAAMPESDGNAVEIVSSLLRRGRQSTTPSVPSTNFLAQQIRASQGLFIGQTHSHETALSARMQASVQSMLADNSAENLFPAFGLAAAGTSDARRLALANLDRTALVQELINRSTRLPSNAMGQFQRFSGLLASEAGNASQSQAQRAHHQGQQWQPGSEVNTIHSLTLQQGGSHFLPYQQPTQLQQTNPWLQMGTEVASRLTSHAGAERLQEAYQFMGPQSRSAPSGSEKDDEDESDEKGRRKA